MPYTITHFEDTPNPNAVKCWLDRPISAGPRSFRTAEDAANDPVARALFERAGAVVVFFNGDWLTVNKRPDAKWPSIKAKVQKVLAEAAER
jgi:NFU1 iron-sulfur cluster scaffold homolog, mitochondrial